jgi:hypothetical protein
VAARVELATTAAGRAAGAESTFAADLLTREATRAGPVTALRRAERDDAADVETS